MLLYASSSVLSCAVRAVDRNFTAISLFTTTQVQITMLSDGLGLDDSSAPIPDKSVGEAGFIICWIASVRACILATR